MGFFIMLFLANTSKDLQWELCWSLACDLFWSLLGVPAFLTWMHVWLASFFMKRDLNIVAMHQHVGQC
jgi:hypothetical protein